jgi:hypothetical protein
MESKNKKNIGKLDKEAKLNIFEKFSEANFNPQAFQRLKEILNGRRDLIHTKHSSSQGGLLHFTTSVKVAKFLIEQGIRIDDTGNSLLKNTDIALHAFKSPDVYGLSAYDVAIIKSPQVASLLLQSFKINQQSSMSAAALRMAIAKDPNICNEQTLEGKTVLHNPNIDINVCKIFS